MNKVEQAAQAAQAGHEGQLLPLRRNQAAAPALSAAWVAATSAVTLAATAIYQAGNAVTDYVGNHTNPEINPEALSGKTGAELLSIRQNGVRS
ncbi:hypothetical protein [Saccharomonospora piscinae]|uniref:hypothetical protein n=1 Tax=Saccharomonospora piscinae TaxID=687388 RepID=UPI00046636D9|nr:hypothetical protein [Saccharomonospora piscinae]